MRATLAVAATGEIGHFFADLLQRLVGVALYLLARLGQGGFGLGASLLHGISLGVLTGLARPFQYGRRLFAGLGQLLLVAGQQQLVGVRTQLLRIFDRLD